MHPVVQWCGIRSCGTLTRCLDQVGPDEEIDGDILSSRYPLAQRLMPGGKCIDPGLQGVTIAPELRHWETAPPAVIDQGCHGYFVPVRRLGMAITQDTTDEVMPIGKHIGFD